MQNFALALEQQMRHQRHLPVVQHRQRHLASRRATAARSMAAVARAASCRAHAAAARISRACTAA